MSVPDADVLIKLAEVLDTKVSILLGGSIADEEDKDAVAEQLAKISEQLAIKNRRNKRIWKTIGIILLVIVVLNILSVIIFMTVPPTSSDVDNSVITEINDETVYEQ